MNRYEDIIHHLRPTCNKPLPLEKRAAQFAPFAVLQGHQEAIDAVVERSKLTL